MQGWQRASVRNRAIAVMLTLAVHGLFVLLLLFEKRFPRRELPPSPQLVSMWIHLPPLPAPSEAVVSAPALPVRRPEFVPLPITPVTPAESVEVLPAQPVEEPSPARIDWHAEAARLTVQRAGEPEAAALMGRPLQKMREPCKPRDSSFEWNPEEEKAGLAPLPYVIIGDRCLVTVGYFSCVLGALPPPNKNLFDDMRAGRTPHSSVPDPNVCD